jgi:putative transposase
MCILAVVSRAGFYRETAPAPARCDELELRDQVQRIALESVRYGSRRVTAELRRCGWVVNRKRVQRLMREDNLLCLRNRSFIVVTTDSKHRLPVYPNLAKTMVLDGINQLWRADITYIRLRVEFIYLAVILDAYSRRVIGWALDRTLETSLTITALEMALAERGAPPGLVHHSDRGCQYASHDYTAMLREHGIAISMSRKGNPWDNAACESFMKTLKCEEVDRCEYLDLADAGARIGEFLEDVYNEQRLHSALGYCPPSEFERGLLASPKAGCEVQA